MKRDKLKIRYGGFTLVELLTTLAVIGILLGLLVPALNMVSKTANKVKQKAQFHAIGTALEAFRNDYGDYPPSMWDPDPTDYTDGYVYGYYSASQRLAEALIGRDGFGFHPSSQFREDGMGDANGDSVLDVIYGNPSTYTAETPADNLAARQGPYLELESANAVTLENLYGAGNHNPLVDSFVLVDMYKVTKNKTTAKMTGSPILYYKANRLKTSHDVGDIDADPTLNRCTYNIYDALGGLGLDGLAGGTIPPLVDGIHFESGSDAFYEKTLNPNFTSPPRPYRSESFILHSAGPDGLYGTMDDVFNFDQDN